MRLAVLTADRILGSDALVYLDGRWNAASIDDRVRERVESMKEGGLEITGYAVYAKDQSLRETPAYTVRF